MNIIIIYRTKEKTVLYTVYRINLAMFIIRIIAAFCYSVRQMQDFID